MDRENADDRDSKLRVDNHVEGGVCVKTRVGLCEALPRKTWGSSVGWSFLGFKQIKVKLVGILPVQSQQTALLPRIGQSLRF
jgi:hypothetical protein